MKTPPDGLTVRELQFARLVADGHGPKAIGTQLNLSENYVKNTLWTIYQKVGVNTSHQLCAYVWGKRFERLQRLIDASGQGPNAKQCVSQSVENKGTYVH